MLSFYVHSRQRYAPHSPLRDGAEDEIGIVGANEEFAVVLHRFGKEASLSPQVRVFTDGFQAAGLAAGMGVFHVLSMNHRTVDDLANSLRAIGLHEDRSMYS